MEDDSDFEEQVVFVRKAESIPLSDAKRSLLVKKNLESALVKNVAFRAKRAEVENDRVLANLATYQTSLADWSFKGMLLFVFADYFI